MDISISSLITILCSSLLCSILLYSILLYSILFYSILYYILSYCILFCQLVLNSPERLQLEVAVPSHNQNSQSMSRPSHTRLQIDQEESTKIKFSILTKLERML